MSKIENYYHGCLIVSTYGEHESHEVICDGVSEKERKLIAAEGLSRALLMLSTSVEKRIKELRDAGNGIGVYPTLANAIRVARGREELADPDDIDTEVNIQSPAG